MNNSATHRLIIQEGDKDEYMIFNNKRSTFYTWD
uniref:Uncharacterized protein n=1 Tax=Arundo donax TaxID=35708 RepID=A0A0A8YKI5_ARUDO